MVEESVKDFMTALTVPLATSYLQRQENRELKCEVKLPYLEAPSSEYFHNPSVQTQEPIDVISHSNCIPWYFNQTFFCCYDEIHDINDLRTKWGGVMDFQGFSL